jgi:hypothetical protein
MWLFKSNISQGVKDLAQSIIDNPHDWRQGDYYFSHLTHKDLRIWTASGWSFLKLIGNDSFTREEKKYLNKAIQQSIANRLRTQPKI